MGGCGIPIRISNHQEETHLNQPLCFWCYVSWTHFPPVLGVNSPDKQGWIMVGHSCMIFIRITESMMFWIWQFSNKIQGHVHRKQILGNHFWERFLGSLSSCLNLLELHSLFLGEDATTGPLFMFLEKLQLLRCQKSRFFEASVVLSWGALNIVPPKKRCVSPKNLRLVWEDFPENDLATLD